mmetsp:Transcript_49110/g.95995  ORF Transcript_49110/g.95995 Transcript_49110/m.95995 type:complete len:109 (+) Transcript_49110:468-794(+)
MATATATINQEWSCEFCTYQNTNSLHLCCEMCGQSRPNNESHISSRTVSRYLLDITIAQITKECVVAHRQGAANLVSPLMEQMRKLKGKLNDYPSKSSARTSPPRARA